MSGLSPRFRGARQPAAGARRAGQGLVRPAVAGAVALAAVGTVVLGAVGLSSSDAAERYVTSVSMATSATASSHGVAAAAASLAAERRENAASRSAALDAQRRAAITARKAAAAKKAADAEASKKAAKKAAATKAAKRLAQAQADPKAVARSIMGEYGFGADQWSCLDRLWIGESNWNYAAANPSSGAYGIPQSLPGTKMASVGPDWRTNPETQIRWGLEYVRASYGTPCGALGAWQSRYPHWY